MEAQEKEEILTGVFYIDTQKPTFIDQLNVVDEPLATLPESLTRPPKSGARQPDGEPAVAKRGAFPTAWRMSKDEARSLGKARHKTRSSRAAFGPC